MEPEKGQKKKNRFLPPKNLEILAKNSIVEVPRSGRIDPYQNFQIWSYSDPFHQTFHLFSHFWFPTSLSIWKFFEKINLFWKNQAPGPIANERTQNSASDALIKSSGNLHPTDLVTKKRQKLETCSFSNCFSAFFLIKMTSWQPGTLLKWKISKFRSGST